MVERFCVFCFLVALSKSIFQTNSLNFDFSTKVRLQRATYSGRVGRGEFGSPTHSKIVYRKFKEN